MESQIIRRLFLALKCIVTQTLSGPGEEMSKALSNLIQVGPALGRGGGFSQLTFRGPFQPGLFCGSWTECRRWGGHACFGWRGQELGGRRHGTLTLEMVVLEKLH